VKRRDALRHFAGWLAASPSAAQRLGGEPPGRIAPIKELVNVLEAEEAARRSLSPSAFAAIAGSDRAAFDRITLRPRLMVETLEMNLSLELFGEKLFAPILVGPASGLTRFHSEAPAALLRGAAAAKAVTILAAENIRHAESPFWVQIDAAGDIDAQRARAAEAARLGAKAIVVTVDEWNWPAIGRFLQGLPLPVILKGVMTAAEARTAVEQGLQGLVVSNWRKRGVSDAAPIDVLPEIVDAVAGKIPVLADGSFRRGTDILKALAFGARAVLVTRPPLWGLAAYGSDGVQHVLELLQSELARAMAMCGIVNLGKMNRAYLRVHRR
jgi:isopentenyl diphosphate isomerase/L-lactate dehydrogenase-like FMN-dependent dehydrogenase